MSKTPAYIDGVIMRADIKETPDGDGVLSLSLFLSQDLTHTRAKAWARLIKRHRLRVSVSEESELAATRLELARELIDQKEKSVTAMNRILRDNEALKKRNRALLQTITVLTDALGLKRSGIMAMSDSASDIVKGERKLDL